VLRYREKEDIEARFAEVDSLIREWRELRAGVLEALEREFRSKLLVSIIYHDAALEGEVLTYSEIKAAVDTKIISDTSLIPAYEDIKCFNDALMYALEYAANKRNKQFKLDNIREVYARLSPAEDPKGVRKDNPLHRLYYHEIAPPEKILPRMKKLGEWLESPECRDTHPVERAARTHWELMSIFPWTKQSGRAARIIANAILEQGEYPLAVIHQIDRQRYYESLRSPNSRTLLSIYLEAIETTANAALRVYEEAGQIPRRRAS
jgi:Fic family protein